MPSVSSSQSSQSSQPAQSAQSFRPARLQLPVVVWALAAIGPALLVIPLVVMLVSVPWSQFSAIVSSAGVSDAIVVSLWAGSQATAIAVCLAIPLAVAIHALPRGKNIARALVLLPIALPPVVAGLALTHAAKLFHLDVPFTFQAVVISHVFVILPYATIAIDAALGQTNRSIHVATASLGVSPWRVFRSVTLRTIAPAILSAAALSFARSLGEFGATVTFAGSLPGVTRTLTLSIYLERELAPERAVVLSTILIAVAIVALFVAALPVFASRSPRHTSRRVAAMSLDDVIRLTHSDTSAPQLDIHWQGQSIHIPAGSTVAIVGHNGSGKSTLAGLIAGTLIGAQVRVGGVDVSALPVGKRGIAYIPQMAALPPAHTVESAVGMVAGKDASSVIDACGLRPLANTATKRLSGGQTAHVLLTRAAAVRPGVLIADEPFHGLDSDSVSAWHEIFAAWKGNRTVVLITHDANDVQTLADVVIVLCDGQIQACSRRE